MNEEDAKRAEPSGQGDPGVLASVEPDLSPDLIRQQLDRILTSSLFSQAPRASRFLRFIVETALEGRSSELKEYVIGITVFDRKETYDPRLDPIVRVEAVRLRDKIKKYYETFGQNEPVRIDLPKRSYAPLFRRLETMDVVPAAHSSGAEAAEESAATTPQLQSTDPALLPASRRRAVWLIPAAGAALVAFVGFMIWLSTRSAQPSDAATVSRDLSRILVLPFTDVASQDGEEYYSAGLTDELIHTLTRIEGLRIVPTYAFRYKGQAQDIRKINQELNAGTVIGGSVYRANNRVRVTVQISDTGTEQAIWSASFERNANDLLTLPEEISNAVISALRRRIEIPSTATAATSRTKNAEAYALYLKGRYHWNRRSESSIRRAIGYFEAALKQDSRYALAYSGLADCYGLLGHIGSSPPVEVMPKAKVAAQKALELDPALPEAHSSLGYVEFFYEWNWSAAERHFRRAIELNPQYTPAHLWYSSLLMSVGRSEEAVQHCLRAEKIDPLSPIVARFLADNYYRMGAYDKAIRKCQDALELDPNFGSAYVFLGRAYARKGRFAQSIEAYQKAAEISGPSYRTTALIAHSHAAWGKRDEARALLKELEARAQREYVGPFYIALVHAGLGDNAEALRWLSKAFAEHSVWLPALPIDSNFDSLRKEPQFEALLRNLPASQQHAF